jgi:hypothetical protein
MELGGEGKGKENGGESTIQYRSAGRGHNDALKALNNRGWERKGRERTDQSKECSQGDTSRNPFEHRLWS